MKVEPKIPEGYRLLQPGEKIQDGDRCFSMSGFAWVAYVFTGEPFKAEPGIYAIRPKATVREPAATASAVAEQDLFPSCPTCGGAICPSEAEQSPSTPEPKGEPEQGEKC